MQVEFSQIVENEDQLRAILGYPSEQVAAKAIPVLDKHCRAYIAKSPFLLIASSDTAGNVDISPKGDPPGFVHVLDDQTLAIPDRLGNRRADTFLNILQNDKIGLFFLIPGQRESLRVSGRAQIVRDDWLRERMTLHGKTPDLAIVVKVEEAFAHCAKCVIRSKIWQAEQWPDLDGLPSIAQMMVDHAKLSTSVEEMEAAVEESYRTRLY